MVFMLQAILHTAYFPSKLGQAISAGATVSPAPSGAVLARDTYEPSGSKETDRSELLKAVKNRIKSGFYNSEVVVDDLSNVIAKAMNRIL